MPRHLLVKRHRYCSGTLLYRDYLQDGADSDALVATIIDTHKQMIIRECDYNMDYSGYSSPDSGYAASPNSVYIGFARDNENLATDRESNSLYTCTNVRNCDVLKHTGAQDGSSNSENNINCSGSQVSEPLDAPLDLSKKTSPPYCAMFQIKQAGNEAQMKGQPQKQLPCCPPSSNHFATSVKDTVAAQDFHFCNKLSPSGKSNKHLNQNMSFLFSSNTTNNQTIVKQILPRDPHDRSFLQGKTKINTSMDKKTSVQRIFIDDSSNEILPTSNQCAYVPTAKQQRFPSSIVCGTSTTPVTAASETIRGRTTPLETPAGVSSPKRKRINTDAIQDVSSPDSSKRVTTITTKDIYSPSMTKPCSKETLTELTSASELVVKKSLHSLLNGIKAKAVRRLNFDIDTTSPVSGTIIKDAIDFHPKDGKIVYGDIDPSLNVVEVTPEARAELEKIHNKIGDYICQLCKEFFQDAFQLAQHRCSRIVDVEYRCPECEKTFNCPANLASHRRWHKPRHSVQKKVNDNSEHLSSVQNASLSPEYKRHDVNNDTAHVQEAAVPTQMLVSEIIQRNKQVTSINITEPKQVTSINITEPKQVTSINITEPKQVTSINITEPEQVTSVNISEPKQVTSINITEPKSATSENDGSLNCYFNWGKRCDCNCFNDATQCPHLAKDIRNNSDGDEMHIPALARVTESLVLLSNERGDMPILSPGGRNYNHLSDHRSSLKYRANNDSGESSSEMYKTELANKYLDSQSNTAIDAHDSGKSSTEIAIQESDIICDVTSSAKPAHTTPNSRGSSLTIEERSLVIQSINSHDCSTETAPITSATTTTPALVSGSHCSTDTTISRNVDHNNICDKTVNKNIEAVILQNAFLNSSPLTDEIINVSSSLSFQQHHNLASTNKGSNDRQQKQNLQKKSALFEGQNHRWNVCSVCGKKFKRETFLRKHFASQHSKDNGDNMLRETISISNKTTNSKVEIMTPHERRDICSFPSRILRGECGKTFTDKSVRLNLESLTNGFTSKLACSSCDMTFTKKTALDKHVLSIHAAKVYSCKHCPSTFHSSPGLTRHINKYHQTESKQVILLKLPTARTG